MKKYNTCSVNAVRAELGRYPLSFHIWTSCIKYWSWMKHEECPNYLLKQAYNMSQTENTTWLNGIKGLLTLNGFGTAWGETLPPKRSGNIFIQRLKDQYIQMWNSIKISETKHEMLSLIQDEYKYPEYLDNTENTSIQTRAAFTALRLGLCSSKHGKTIIFCNNCGVPRTSLRLLLNSADKASVFYKKCNLKMP